MVQIKLEEEKRERNKQRCKEWREKNPEKAKEGSRKWRQNNHKKNEKIQRSYSEKNKKKKNKWQEKYAKDNPIIIAAHNAVHNNKIPLGDKCNLCGTSANLEHHHPDYNKPLLIITYCRRCHASLHRGEIKNVR